MTGFAAFGVDPCEGRCPSRSPEYFHKEKGRRRADTASGGDTWGRFAALEGKGREPRLSCTRGRRRPLGHAWREGLAKLQAPYPADPFS
jgi:hypothetical protein